MSHKMPAPSRRRRRLSRACSAVAVLVGATVLPGCGGPTTLTKVADTLQAGLTSMPGVIDAWVYHDEGFAEGVIFSIAVDMRTASRAEIAAVADRIAATRLDLIPHSAESVEFWVAADKPATITRQSHLDATQIADDAERLRAIADDADGRIDWFRGDDGTNQLSLRGTATPGTQLLDVVGRSAGDTGVVMSVSPTVPSARTPRMQVAFPISAQDQASILQFVAAIPVGVVGLRIDTDGVRVLETMAPADPAVAEADLTTVIDASKAIAARPMWLSWSVPSELGGVPMPGGVIEVGDCSAPAALIRQAAQRVGEYDGTSLQDRLQAKADTCATVDPDMMSARQSPPPPLSPSPAITLSQLPSVDSATAADVISLATTPRPVSTPCGTSQLAGIGGPSCTSSTSASGGNGPAATPVAIPIHIDPPLSFPGPVPAAAQPGGGPSHPSPPSPHRSASRTAHSPH